LFGKCDTDFGDGGKGTTRKPLVHHPSTRSPSYSSTHPTRYDDDVGGGGKGMTRKLSRSSIGSRTSGKSALSASSAGDDEDDGFGS
jgi:hypothetical protein